MFHMIKLANVTVNIWRVFISFRKTEPTGWLVIGIHYMYRPDPKVKHTTNNY